MTQQTTPDDPPSGGSIDSGIPRSFSTTYRRSDVNRGSGRRAREETQGGNNNDWLARRYHAAQADPTRDTALKMIARRSGDPKATVRCSCGCGQDFPATVRRPAKAPR